VLKPAFGNRTIELGSEEHVLEAGGVLAGDMKRPIKARFRICPEAENFPK
jgi:hypothetical protein